MIRFMALTGCRKAEALGLTRAMIDRNRAALPNSKTGAKSLWLGRATRRLLKARPNGTAHVFAKGDGTPLSPPDLKPVWEVVRQALGNPRLRLHDLRHSFASVAITMGHDLVIVGGLLGHKDKSSTEGYVHLADKHIAAASSRVGRHLGKIIGRDRKPRSVFEQYLRSKDRLAVFCSTRDLDPKRFSRDLRVWRISQAGGSAQ